MTAMRKDALVQVRFESDQKRLLLEIAEVYKVGISDVVRAAVEILAENPGLARLKLGRNDRKQPAP